MRSRTLVAGGQRRCQVEMAEAIAERARNAGMKTPCGVVNGKAGPDRIVALAHHHLGLDVVAVMELDGDNLEFRVVAQNGSALGTEPGEGQKWAGPYFRQLLAGEIPSFSGDTAAVPRLAHLPSAPGFRVGAYIGVPLRYSDGAVYGVLCGFDQEPDPTLGQRDIRIMEMLAELLVSDLDEQRRLARLRLDIGRLIATEDVRIAWQPIMDLRTSRCMGFEALSRFPKPFTRPDGTFAAAAEVGLGLELERLAVIQMWKCLPQLGPDQFASVNLSPSALLVLTGLAKKRNVLPLEKLVVEVTEHSVVDNYAELREALTPLRERGLRVAIDDAGAGYASLHHIVELRPDFIKVDRSLVGGLADDHARRVATRAFVILARDMGSLVIAEGVERASDLAALRELGVDAAQGHLLARPRIGSISRWANIQLMPVNDHGGPAVLSFETERPPLPGPAEIGSVLARAGP